MANREELQKRLLATFRDEAAEHVDALVRELQLLSSARSPIHERQQLDNLFRVMHTLKGAARSVRFESIEHICQDSEAMLQALVRGTMTLSDDKTAFLKRSTERIQTLIFADLREEPTTAVSAPPQPEAVAGPTANPPPAAELIGATAEREETVSPAIAAKQAIGGTDPPQNEQRLIEDTNAARQFESVRVNVDRLDRLVLAAEELLLPSLVMSERSRTARDVMEDIRRLRAEVRALKTNQGTDGGHRIHATALTALKEIEAKSRRLALALADDHRGLRAAVSDLFSEARQARMVPAATMLAAFPAMVRDLCRETGKQAKWRFHDAGIELDRKVIELAKDPLIHLVRNAIDHGIERPEEREAAGKKPRGRVTVSISPIEGSRVAITIADDGRGMNLAALREAAVRSRYVTGAQVQALPDNDVIDLAFRPGISTSAVITTISGLGLGLSIVREQVERIDGTVSVRSTPGHGTAITLELPTTIASYRALLVTAGGTRLLFPAEAVDRVFGIPRASVAAGLRSGLIVHNNETLPLVNLASVMGMASQLADERRHLVPCVVIESGSRWAAFLVEDVLGETDVLVKDLPMPLRRVRNISSAGLLASGELALILRMSDLLVAAQEGGAELEESGASDRDRAMRVLVVDDSITTRTMERNLLESAGYAVLVASDGIDAWSILQTADVDIVVSDIDMPRMNGFDLTARIRNDARLGELPVVLVTALESRDDKERGIKIGANAYVLKSSFDQSNLLDVVGRLV